MVNVDPYMAYIRILWVIDGKRFVFSGQIFTNFSPILRNQGAVHYNAWDTRVLLQVFRDALLFPVKQRLLLRYNNIFIHCKGQRRFTMEFF